MIEQVHAAAARSARKLLRDCHAAEDIAQEAALRALRCKPSQPQHWGAVVGANMAKDHLRKRATARLSFEPASAPKQDYKPLRQAIEQLPPQQQQAIELRLQGCSCKEIAERTGATATAIRLRLHRARAALAKMLEP